MIDPVSDKPPKKRIVILGGGFGGVYAAIHLEKLLARMDEVEICLVSRDNFFLFTPMLPETAAGSIGTRHIVSPLRKLLRRTRFAEVGIEHIDLGSQIVSARHSLTGAAREFAYDEGAERALAEAPERRWTIVSMKDDFATVF